MITLKQLKNKLEKEFGWENLESDDNKWLVDDLLKDTIQAMNYTHCCEELLCVDKWCYNDLTKGNKYKLITQDDEYYTIVNDWGEITQKDKDLFELIKQ